MPIVDAINILKRYEMGGVAVDALRGVNVSFERGEYVAIMGPSGSGKSTFLNLLGCLDQPTSGKYLLDGQDVAQLTDNELSDIRSQRIGFVFQSFNLIRELNVIENIEMPLFYQGVPQKQCEKRATILAESVGLSHRLRHHPIELSGGEQQRVAIARALANDPLIILADEPTGNLDSKSGADILNLLDELHEKGKTIVIVTHDNEIGQRTPRLVRFKDGEIIADELNNRAA